MNDINNNDNNTEEDFSNKSAAISCTGDRRYSRLLNELVPLSSPLKLNKNSNNDISNNNNVNNNSNDNNSSNNDDIKNSDYWNVNWRDD